MKPFESWEEIRDWLEETGTSPAGRQLGFVWIGLVHRMIGRMDVSWWGGNVYSSQTRHKAAA